MNTLERLKELNDGNEWDFNDLGFLVNALPDLLAVVEAAKGRQQCLTPEEERISYNKLESALAKLEVSA